MSGAVMCDNCGVFLGPLSPAGDDEDGERAGWIQIEAGGKAWDVCTRSCATRLLDDPESPLVVLMDDFQEAIADIVRVIRDGDE